MTKIYIKIANENNSILRISNSNNISIDINMDEPTIKAFDIYKLFDNGVDVTYECGDKKIEAMQGQNLNRTEQMFNDCLELVNEIINSVNQKLCSYHNGEFEQIESDEHDEIA